MIREQIMGGWRLVRFESRLADGRILSPLGRNARGYILYTPDGHVGVNLMRAVRARESAGQPFHRLADLEAGAVAKGYMAYAGRFEIDEARAIVRHHFELCLDPALIGTLQERHVRFVDGMLELSVRLAEGVEHPSVLLWARE